MPRTKKQKIQKRSWNDDEEIQRYDLVAKNPVLYKLPQNSYDRILLFGDVIIDINTLISNQKTYVPKIQIGLVRMNKMVKLVKEQQLVFYLETAQKQLTDFNFLVNMLNSLSSQAAHDLALRINQLQVQTCKTLKSITQNNESQKSLISLQYDPEQLLERCFIVAKQHLDYEGQVFNFNLYTFDPEKMRMNRYLNSNHLSILKILCDDEEELKRRFLSYRINQPQGDLDQFIRIQIPLLDQEIEEEIKIYTFDNYIILSKIKQKCIRLSENSNNVLMLRLYNFDPDILKELNRVRKVRKEYMQQLHDSLLLDLSNSSSNEHSNHDPGQEYEESLSYDVKTFLLKYEPNID